MSAISKIAITGPESTGKSWLAAALARHYGTTYVPEFARNYIDGLERPYEQSDLLQIAHGQLSAEAEKKKEAHGFLFCDTELIVIKIWSLHKYGNCDPFILETIEKQHYDLYLLCDIDLPWEFDQQREHLQMREYFFNWYRKELVDYGFPFSVVSGKGEERIVAAIEAVEKISGCDD